MKHPMISGEFKAPVQGDRRKNPEMKKYRHFTREEVLALDYGDHPLTQLNNGRIGTCKINGKVRTWKRDPNRVEVPIKYGLYEYGTFDLEEAMMRFVVEVNE